MRKSTALLFAAITAAGMALPARAADLPTLGKYLGFIEGFQYVLEYCRAEGDLPDSDIEKAWEHIAERRGLIFAGLNEKERQTIVTAADPIKKQMLDAFLKQLAKDQPGKSLGELCRSPDFFEGLLDSETKADGREVAAIKKAKS